MSVPFVILEFTNVFVPTFGMGIGTVSIPIAILEFTNVFVPFELIVC